MVQGFGEIRLDCREVGRDLCICYADGASGGCARQRCPVSDVLPKLHPNPPADGSTDNDLLSSSRYNKEQKTGREENGVGNSD